MTATTALDGRWTFFGAPAANDASSLDTTSRGQVAAARSAA